MRRRSFFKLLLGTAVLAIAERVPSFALSAPGVPQRVADSAVAYIRQRLREESFARKILGPVAVSRAEVKGFCLRSGEFCENDADTCMHS